MAEIKLASIDVAELLRDLQKLHAEYTSGKLTVTQYGDAVKGALSQANGLERNREAFIQKTRLAVDKTAKSEISRANKLKAFNSLQNDLQKELDQSIKKFNELAKSGQDLSKAEKEIEDLSKAIKDLRVEADKFEPIDDKLASKGSVDKTKGASDGIKGVGAAVNFVRTAFKAFIALEVIQFFLNLGRSALQLTSEIKELEAQISSVTGLSGEALSTATAEARAIAATFDKDIQDIVTAANAASSQFGIPFQEAVQNIGSELAAGQNKNEEYLDSLREYPAFFNEIGASIQDFNNVNRLAFQQGIFSDKGVDAVKEGALRLREFTKTTEDALVTAFGADFTKEVKLQVNQGDAFGALQAISAKFGDLDAQAKGIVLADVFGGAGEDAGEAFIASLGNIEGALANVSEESKKLTAENNQLLAINIELANKQNELASNFKDFEGQSKLLGQGLKLGLLSILLEIINVVKENFQPVFNNISSLFQRLNNVFGQTGTQSDRLQNSVKSIGVAFNAIIQPAVAIYNAIIRIVDAFADLYENNELVRNEIDAFVGDLKAFGTFIQNFYNGIALVIEGFSLVITQPLASLTALKQGISNTFADIKDIFSTFAIDILRIGFFDALKKAFTGIGQSFADNTKEAFEDNLDLRTPFDKEVDRLKQRQAQLKEQIGLKSDITVNANVDEVKALEQELQNVNKELSLIDTQLRLIDLQKQIKIETDPIALEVLKNELAELEGKTREVKIQTKTETTGDGKPTRDLETETKRLEQIAKDRAKLLEQINKAEREIALKQIQLQTDFEARLEQTRDFQIEEITRNLEAQKAEILKQVTNGVITQAEGQQAIITLEALADIQITEVKTTANTALIEQTINDLTAELKDIKPVDLETALSFGDFNDLQSRLESDVEKLKETLNLSDVELVENNLNREALEANLQQLQTLLQQTVQTEAQTNKERIDARLKAIQDEAALQQLSIESNGLYYNELGQLTTQGENTILDIKRKSLEAQKKFLLELVAGIEAGTIDVGDLGIDVAGLETQIAEVNKALLGIQTQEIEEDVAEIEEAFKKLEEQIEGTASIFNAIGNSFGFDISGLTGAIGSGIFSVQQLKQEISTLGDATKIAEARAVAGLTIVGQTLGAAAQIAGQAIDGLLQKAQETGRLIDEELNSRRDATQAQLEEQLERQEQGFANSVEAVQERLNKINEIQALGIKESLDLSKLSLEELTALKQENLKEQQRLAKAQIAADTAQQISALALAAAQLIAAEASKGLVGIALSVGGIALIFSTIAKARAQANAIQAPQFYEGGYTGTGNPKQVSTHLGTRPYVYHKNEYIIPHKPTQEYKDNLLEGVHKGKRNKVVAGVQRLMNNFGIGVEEVAPRQAVNLQEFLAPLKPLPERPKFNYPDVKAMLEDVEKSNNIIANYERRQQAKANFKYQQEMLKELQSINQNTKETAGNTGEKVNYYSDNGKVVKVQDTKGGTVKTVVKRDLKWKK